MSGDLVGHGIEPPLPIQRPRNTALRWLRTSRLKEGVSLAVRHRMCIQHDGAPTRFNVYVRNYLNAVFPGHWIGRGGPIPWPVRSPDLNPPSLFLWEYLNSLVFETPVETDMQLVIRIVAAYDIIQNT